MNDTYLSILLLTFAISIKYTYYGGYLRHSLQVRIPIDMAMDSHTPATEYG